jgi:L-serine dehydratase
MDAVGPGGLGGLDEMTVSVFDLFRIGIGPSSSHTVGPMRAALMFCASLQEDGLLADVSGIRAELFGSLGETGHGHGSVKALVLGLAGQTPEGVDPVVAESAVGRVTETGRLRLLGTHEIGFVVARDIVMHHGQRLPFHSNAMVFTAFDEAQGPISRRTYYSVGGGFVVTEEDAQSPAVASEIDDVSYPFRTGAELLGQAAATGLSISDVMLANERASRSSAQIRGGLLDIWRVMRECVIAGSEAQGVLPGGLGVRRRAAAMRESLQREPDPGDPVHAMEWVTMYALAVNEQNAAGGRVVTAPTNGAAGIIPAVLHYYDRYCVPAGDDQIVRFLLTAGAIGVLLKQGASISGADVGCQGEVGSACAMAAGALAELLGGTADQVENAAEIGLEHNLGLTCDPVGGLVQIPCIERNAVAAVKAITAARLAVRGDGQHRVSLDAAIKTMRETGADMSSKYKETARGGLALNVVEC